MPKPPRYGVRGLTRNRSGRFEIDLRWVDADGAPQVFFRRLPVGTTLKDAREAARKANAAVTLGGSPKPERKAPQRRLHAALDEYAEVMSAERPRTARSRASVVEVIKRGLRDRPLGALTTAEVEAFKRARLKEVSPSTTNRALSVLKHFAGWVRRIRSPNGVADVSLCDP